MKFLTIKEALQEYEVSQTTLTRFARTHEKSKEVKKENRKFSISDSLLASHFQKRNSHLASQTIQISHSEEKESDTVANILKSQNEFLQSQIVEKDSQINKLLQRQSEQNIIIQTLQNRMDLIGTKIDDSVLLLAEKVSKTPPSEDKDNGFTIAAALMIILLVITIIIFLLNR
jgi:hypothetical protein